MPARRGPRLTPESLFRSRQVLCYPAATVEYAVQDQFDPDLVRQAVDLHSGALSHRSFITSFGKRFLYELYTSLLEQHLAFLVTAREGARLEGFILACSRSSRLMSAVTSRPLRFLPIIVPQLLRRPRLILKTIQTLFYSSREGTDVEAELVVIAVSEGERSRGVGTALVRVLEDSFRARGIGRYKVTVHTEMSRSNNFYLRRGMTVHNTFELYGVSWNLYLQDLAPGAPG